ncbi:MAG: type 1 periplasmic binding fold superfamily protein [Myxococcota bacterium]
MMKKLKTLSFCLPLAVLGLTACGEDEADNGNGGDEGVETITQVILTFTAAGGGDTVATWTDQDGQGGMAPTITPITLVADETYSLAIRLLDTTNPADIENITEEIQEEDDEHQFFFEGTGVDSETFTGSNPLVTVSYADFDGNGRPLGLSADIDNVTAGMGETFVVLLKHQPPVNGQPVKTDTSDRNTGDTDVEATFDLIVTGT